MAISLPKKDRPETPLMDPRDLAKSTPHPKLVEPLIKVSLDKAWPDRTVKIETTLPEERWV